MEHSQAYLAIPHGVISKVDVGRLLREVEALNDFMHQSAIRTPGTPMRLPRTSKLLDETIEANKLNMLVREDRERLLQFLRSVYTEAPVMHMSFGADPSPLFVSRLITWLRQEIHPVVLLQVGLQMNLGAGCIVRTTNHQFDFSLRNRFKDNRELLSAKIREAIK